MKVCSVCGSTLEGDGTMNRQQYFHPPDTVSACLNGEWKPITPQQLADELAALRECVRAADDYLKSIYSLALGTDLLRGVWAEKEAFYDKRAKVTP